MGKRDRLLDAQATCLQEYYINMTYAEAWKFSKWLLNGLQTEIVNLKYEVSKCANLLTEGVREFDHRITIRCTDAGLSDFKKSLVQFYNPQIVKELTEFLTTDKIVQQTQTNEVRKALVAQLGEQPDFAIFNAHISKQRFIDILESECEKAAVDAHNIIIASNKYKSRQFGVNIIEKLYSEFRGNDDGLKKYMNNLVGHAGNYLIFDSLEVTKRGPGISDSPAKIAQFTVILPKASEHADFSEKLKNIIRGCRREAVEFIETDVKKNEITFVSLTNLFPLRFMRQLSFLRNRYDDRINRSDTERAKLELHCEGDGSNHPRLFVPSYDELIQDGLPLILIAKSVGIIQSKENVTTGKTELLLITKDQYGLDKAPIKFGHNIIESIDKIDPENIEIIRSSVSEVISKDYQHVGRQDELIGLIRNEIEWIKTQCREDYDAPLYKRFLDAGKKAIEIIKQ